MRDLKFRAWDKNTNKWMVLPNYSWYAYSEDELSIIMGRGDMVFMQYTGLKDKNDKEIYEGDILSDGSGFMAEVVWYQTRSGFGFTVAKQYEPADLLPAQMLKCEVIGNIYENPELLK